MAVLLATFTLTAVTSMSAQSAISITSERVRHGDAWQWRAASVDASREHFELRFGRADDDWDRWQPIARIGKPMNGVFPVEFLVEDGDAEDAAVAAVRSHLDYYLVERAQPDPWSYAIYHATTLANLYSRVHWLHLRPRASTD